MSLFDPLGLLALFTVHGKLLLQDLWRLGFDWDDEIDDGSYWKWKQWRTLLPLVEQVSIPRCYLRAFPPEAYGTLQLHVFVDASEQGYGCVAYFRLLTEYGVMCSLVMAKTKVAALKQISIPRMELDAAVLGVRMMNTIGANHNLKFIKRVIWSDSRTVLSWIHSEQRKYKPFVAFRIGEILQETKLDEWRWIPTKLNIADLLTKWGKGHLASAASPTTKHNRRRRACFCTTLLSSLISWLTFRGSLAGMFCISVTLRYVVETLAAGVSPVIEPTIEVARRKQTFGTWKVGVHRRRKRTKQMGTRRSGAGVRRERWKN